MTVTPMRIVPGMRHYAQTAGDNAPSTHLINRLTTATRYPQGVRQECADYAKEQSESRAEDAMRDRRTLSLPSVARGWHNESAARTTHPPPPIELRSSQVGNFVPSGSESASCRKRNFSFYRGLCTPPQVSKLLFREINKNAPM